VSPNKSPARERGYRHTKACRPHPKPHKRNGKPADKNANLKAIARETCAARARPVLKLLEVFWAVRDEANGAGAGSRLKGRG
jgi:hypothetical protein